MDDSSANAPIAAISTPQPATQLNSHGTIRIHLGGSSIPNPAEVFLPSAQKASVALGQPHMADSCLANGNRRLSN